MKEFSHHESCPKCGSRDNLGVWTDGQKWCFGCGIFLSGNDQMSNKEIEQKLLQQEEKTPDALNIYLPSDFSPSLRLDAQKWLSKYDISWVEKMENSIGWSDKYESLVFPIFDCNENLLLVQRRYFGNQDFPRYHTKGMPESIFHIMGPEMDTVILVEDFISAIKVGRQYQVMPLWGSSLSLRQVKVLSDRYENLIFWLDKDKAKQAVKLKWRASPFFKRIAIVVSDHDPKEYDDETISNFVSGNL